MYERSTNTLLLCIQITGGKFRIFYLFIFCSMFVMSYRNYSIDFVRIKINAILDVSSEFLIYCHVEVPRVRSKTTLKSTRGDLLFCNRKSRQRRRSMKIPVRLYLTLVYNFCTANTINIYLIYIFFSRFVVFFLNIEITCWPTT